jgi:hypothetical protein
MFRSLVYTVFKATGLSVQESDMGHSHLVRHHYACLLCSCSQARELLFYPTAEDMELYPRLLAAQPAGAPDSHPQAKAQVLALTGLYLVHARCWERVKPFSEAGGLM